MLSVAVDLKKVFPKWVRFGKFIVFGVLDQSIFLKPADKFLVGEARFAFALVKVIDVFQLLVEQFRRNFGDLIDWYFLFPGDVGERSVESLKISRGPSQGYPPPLDLSQGRRRGRLEGFCCSPRWIGSRPPLLQQYDRTSTFPQGIDLNGQAVSRRLQKSSRRLSCHSL